MFFRFLFALLSIVLLQAASGTAFATTFRLEVQSGSNMIYTIDGFFDIEITDDGPGYAFGTHSISVGEDDTVSDTGTPLFPAITYSRETRFYPTFNRFSGIIFSDGLQDVPGSDKSGNRQLRLRFSRFQFDNLIGDLTSGNDIDIDNIPVGECYNCVPSRGTRARVTWTSPEDDTPAVVPLPATLGLSLGGLALLGGLRFRRNRT